MLKLYDYFRSSACFRVRIALHLKQLSYQMIPIHLVNNGGEQHHAHYRKRNPYSLVPTLEIDDQYLLQSLAIIEYIDELYPNPSLLPKESNARAYVRSIAFAIAADAHPLNNLRVLKYLTDVLKISETQKNAWYQHWVQQTFASLEEQLKQAQLFGTFCFGDQPTLADLCLVPQMFNARRFNCPLDAYPTLVAIDAVCQKHPAFMDAWPHEVSGSRSNHVKS